MLVFKRALSVALSALLACPATVYARNEKPQARRGFVATPGAAERVKSKAATKRGRTPQSMTRSVPSNVHAAKSQVELSDKMSPKAALSSVMPKSFGKRGDFNVVEVKGKGNRLKSRTITRGDFREIVVDEDGDGTADVYEVTRGSLTAKAYRPYRGNFTHLEYTQRREKGTVSMLMILNPKTQKYDTVTSSIDQSKKMLNENSSRSGVRAGAICKEDLASLTSFEDMLKEIQAAVGGEKAAALECKLNAFQDAFFDKSCDSGDFKESKSAMIKGLSKLMSSHGTKNPSQYLQCLEDNGFGFHAAKIQSTLGSRLSDAKSNLSWSAVAGDSAFLNNSCERLDKVEVYKDSESAKGETKQKKFHDIVKDGSKKKLIKCSKDSSCFASYKNGQITMCADKTAASAGYGILAEDAYGSILFHELLHDSGMTEDDEPTIYRAQNCCAPSKYDAASTAGACASLKQEAANNQFMAVISQTEGYRTALQQLPSLMGSDARRYLEDVAIDFRDSQEGKDALAKLATCQTSAGSDETRLEACRVEALDKVAAFAVPYTEGKKCDAWKVSATTRNYDCKKIAETLVTSLRSRSTTLRAPIIFDGELMLAPMKTDISELYNIVPLPPLAPPTDSGSTAQPATGGEKTAKSVASGATGTKPVGTASGGPATGGTASSGAATSGTGSTGAATGGQSASNGQPASGAPPSTAAPAGSADNGIGFGKPSASTSPGSTTTPGAPTQPGTTAPPETTGPDIVVVGRSMKDEPAERAPSAPVGMPYVPFSAPTGKVTASSGPSMPLGSSDGKYEGTPIVDTITNPSSLPSRLLSAGSSALGSLSQFVASAPANAATAPAKAVVASAASGSTPSNWVRKAETTNRIPAAAASVAANAGGGGGGASAGFAASAGAGPAPTAHSAKGAVAAAEADDLDNEPAAKASAQAPGSRDVAANGNNNLAASWKSGTFRSRFEATKFVTKASADQIIALTATRNSRFEQDLASQQIGIQMGNGRVVGYSSPNYQLCGKRVVALGACR